MATPARLGVEMDIRSAGNRLIVQHDPFKDGEDLEGWLGHYRHRTLILNIKEEGIEGQVKEMVQARGIEDYFFLDLSFPSIVKMIEMGERRAAVRFSEYESIETVLALAGRVDWVWVDCFTRMPLDGKSHALLSKHFKLCLVSPELQGRGHEEIALYRELLTGLRVDAVCTKRADLWTGEEPGYETLMREGDRGCAKAGSR